MDDPTPFRAVTRQAFRRAWERAVQAVRTRPPLSPAERAAGWTSDPAGSGLRHNTITGEWDDSCFVHLAPKRPARPLMNTSNERMLALRTVVKFEHLPRGEESALELDRRDLWRYVHRRIGWAGAARRDPRTFRIDIFPYDEPGWDPWAVGFFDAEDDPD